MEKSQDNIQPPSQFLCPITLEIMKDPVIIQTGQTFERSAIQAWFAQGKNTDPTSNVTLKSKTLISNYSLKHVIQHYLQKKIEKMNYHKSDKKSEINQKKKESQKKPNNNFKKIQPQNRNKQQSVIVLSGKYYHDIASELNKIQKPQKVGFLHADIQVKNQLYVSVTDLKYLRCKINLNRFQSNQFFMQTKVIFNQFSCNKLFYLVQYLNYPQMYSHNNLGHLFIYKRHFQAQKLEQYYNQMQVLDKKYFRNFFTIHPEFIIFAHTLNELKQLKNIYLVTNKETVYDDSYNWTNMLNVKPIIIRQQWYF